MWLVKSTPHSPLNPPRCVGREWGNEALIALIALVALIMLIMLIVLVERRPAPRAGAVPLNLQEPAQVRHEDVAQSKED